MDLRAAAVTNTEVCFRVATYNVHKCQGFDRRIRPERIIEVIRELDADIICLQEVVDAPAGGARFNQAGEIARALSGYAVCFGTNRPLYGGNYGNMTLTRFALKEWENHNVTHKRREERGVLQADIKVGENRVIHVFNVHLGTGYIERRAQAERLLSAEVLRQDLPGPRLVVGDFNEWTRGRATRLLRKSFRTFRPEHGLRFPRTFPGMLPLLSLDYYYYEAPLELQAAKLWRSQKALVASDHLPLLADFAFWTDTLETDSRPS
jgi:endonuclease/exonuclease/phosphatase family metal-dependent hydrolase